MKKFLPELSLMLSKLTDPDFYNLTISEFRHFVSFLKIYFKDKILIFSEGFEGSKNTMVRSVLIKRGKRNRLFLHLAAMAVLTAGAIVSPFISDANFFGENQNLTFAQGTDSSIATVDVFNTETSEKPRDKIITYRVQNGDTISTIAKRFGISEETVKWANDLRSDSITAGDELEILPVTGMAHKVIRGDTVYSIAKKYGAQAQAIADFPFNDFANPQTFSLVEGQILIVPEGVKPEEAPKIVRRQYIASGPATIFSGGFTWPVRGTINQSFSWYHKALDIGAELGSPVIAGQSGVASEVFNGGWNGGYGTHVIISGDNGYSTLYAHMSATNVAPGDPVVAGKTVIGWVGLTGRTTGPHLHWEVRGGAPGFLNPLTVVQ
ncbi:MAG: hypothetical protein A3C27_01585 [Candidatus Levybacteria bacterium RIFCSPHIGHO2_02_FULL_39_36]|uniref:Peptidase M23 family protein n=1 Tax=Candidatus Woesebacteria bacterium GW2011_GWA1_41_13b TaxID=1618555 RepID=A0A0G0USQ9_9BACT|nr:MAG: Peptidase M23 family protein [Candidatus Woesebacteria bacterium GW2011_GWA1_41_13b]OGH14437.1 MAG: hypothetical protein A2689_01860 [Candidatus Levybacteria bacterium RIFCSPHIGHO2_01_FULL_38_96]OGH27891.1 MAG: hypothetical protein A3C27_01585 [Candidatus Levybacteria bacterium RIFCSPHIGHO2_02_FULL_39_36]OGH45549.1 MAG: hypothetical protein A3H82_00660 [Candidatus Levybacteria bacterium RIFCSPLOWO2_02_FULL_39_26]OGH47996.1 MAG: hypothetical protein A3G66_00955 [Candidatus Levybacteria b